MTTPRAVDACAHHAPMARKPTEKQLRDEALRLEIEAWRDLEGPPPPLSPFVNLRRVVPPHTPAAALKFATRYKLAAVRDSGMIVCRRADLARAVDEHEAAKGHILAGGTCQ